ncbi:MAG: hypothetical protein IPG72_01960 [Ardenticatenales bacterium]|nr:hypothetical protein [Ardenticatenales bacterium]
MASLIKAIAAYRPRIARGITVELDQLAEYLSVGTLVTAPLANMVLRELGRQVLLQLKAGNKVRLPGIGLIGAEMRVDGSVYPTVRVERSLHQALVGADAFRGQVVNGGMIGAELAAFRARWDAEHPGDPVVMGGGGGRGRWMGGPVCLMCWMLGS